MKITRDTTRGQYIAQGEICGKYFCGISESLVKAVDSLFKNIEWHHHNETPRCRKTPAEFNPNLTSININL